MISVSKSSFIAGITRFITVVFFFLLSTLVEAKFIDPCWLKPYLGFDAGLRQMTWDNDYGNNVFERHPWQANAYGGLRLNRFLGVEIGYESITHKKHNDSVGSLGTEAKILGAVLDGPVSIRSTVKLSGWHLNLVGFYPLEFWNCFELMGSVGIASLKTSQQFFVLADGDAGGRVFNPPLARTFSQSKVVPRATIGFQYKLTDNLGLRVILLGIENTSSFKFMKPAEGGNALVKMKHNTYHSAGVIFKF